MSSDLLKGAADCASISGTVAVMLGYLPQATVVLTFLWTVLRLYETVVVQNLIERFRNGRK